MNIFILNSGRCGSTTIIRACEHITNYTAGHETRTGRLGEDRFAYPDRHIEADNRLSWLLGRLDLHFGKDAYYVHLTRDERTTAASFVKRYDQGIMHAYRTGILVRYTNDRPPMEVALDYVRTVNTNIAHFLSDKPHRMDFALENAGEDMRRFWEWIGAEGDLGAALAEFDEKHNATMPGDDVRPTLAGRLRRRLLGPR